MSSLWNKIFGATPNKRSKARLNAVKRRGLNVEFLERREVFATDYAVIQGTLFTDANNNNTLDVGEVGKGNIALSLFSETNGTPGFQAGVGGDNAVLNAGNPVTSTTSTTVGNVGQYTFGPAQLGGTANGLVAGTYYVVQPAPTGFNPAATQVVSTVTITTTQAQGNTSFNPIDDFAIPTVADGVQTNNLLLTDSKFLNGATTSIIGGQRDLQATLNAGTANFGINSGAGTLNFFADPATNGNRLVVWDGTDNDATVTATNGLNGADLTNGGLSNAIRLAAGTNQNATGRLTVRSGANSAFIDINFENNGGVTNTAASERVLKFSDFQRPVGQNGAFDFSSVGAIELLVDDANPLATDVAIDFISLIGPTLVTTNIANQAPMTIGDRVFLDLDNDGVFDAGETGIGGVDVQLYLDTNANGTLDTAEINAQTTPRTTVTSTTVGTLGQYSFDGLVPGRYIVVIPASEFGTGQPLVNSSSSPNGTDDKGAPFNNGANFAGLFAAVNLVAGAAPTSEDTDPQTDLTIDFGIVRAPLTVTKTATPTALRVGDQVTYTITVTNQGPSLSTNTVVTDPLPTGLSNATGTFTLTSPNGTGGNAVVAGSNVTATIGQLQPNQIATLTVIATVGATYTGTAANVATATNNESPQATGTNTTPLAPSGDLGITKTIVSGATVVGTENRVGVGTTVTYRLTLTNNSPNGGPTVTNIRVDDNLPTGFTLAGALPNGVTAGTDPADLIWTVATLAPGANVTVDLPILVGATVPTGATPIPNTATIRTSLLTNFNDTNGGTNESGANVGNNASTINVVAEPRYNLLITKTDANRTAATTGDTYTYTLTVNNSGPSAATNVVVSDPLPAQLAFVNATADNNTVTFTNGQNFAANIPSLASGATVTISLVVRVPSSATGTTITNNATVTADNIATQEIVDVNRPNSAQDQNTLTRVETLNITKTDSADPVIAGGAAFNYTITAFNSGSADASNVVISDPLPTGIELVDTNAPGTININDGVTRNGLALTYNTNTRTVSANVGTMLAGGSSTVNRALITLNVRAIGTAAAGTVNNVATITNGTPVNTPQVPTTIQRQVDLAVTKTTTATNVALGQNLTYTIIVSHANANSVSTAQDILITDTLPATLTNGVATTTAGVLQAFTNTNGVITGRLTSLAPGQTATITVTATVANNAPDGAAIVNPVTISTADDSTAGGNNSASASVTVQNLVSLTGTVFNDVNGNNVQDNGEVGIPNVTMTLTGTGALAGVTLTAVTNAAGTYTFNGLTKGVYNLVQTQPVNFVGTTAIPGTTGGTAAANAINTINLQADSTGNNLPETADLSKRGQLASSLGRTVTDFTSRRR